MDCYSLIVKQREALISPEKARYRLSGLYYTKVIQESCITLPSLPSLETSDFDCDNNLLISVHSSSFITIHDLRGPRRNHYDVIATFSCDYAHTPGLHNVKVVKCPLECVNWIHNNLYFTMTGSNQYLICVDTNTQDVLDKVKVPNAPEVYQHKPRPGNQSQLAVAARRHDIMLIDLKIGGVSQYLSGHSDYPKSVAWSSCDEHVLASASENQVFLWDIRMTRKWITLYDDTPTTSYTIVPEVQFVPGRHAAIALTSDKDLLMWDVFSLKRQLIRSDVKITRREHRHRFSIAGDSSPEVLFVPNGSAILMINLETMEVLEELTGHIYKVRTTFFNSLRNELYSAAKEGNIVWEIFNPNLKKCC